jgi:hypothetical protein
VTGPGCPRVGNCVVPNSVLPVVTENLIEDAPFTLAEGEFTIFLRNGNDGQLSKGWPLRVGLR